MAAETDAARVRVLAARDALGEEIDALEASVRAAIDIPARVRRSPARAAGVAGGAAFLVLGGPKRLFGAARRAVFGAPAAMPARMLPNEIEKTLRDLGDDGDKVRGALERDFAAYTRGAAKERRAASLATTVARPLMTRGLKAAAEWFLRTDDEGFQARLSEVRRRAAASAGKPGDRPLRGEGAAGLPSANGDDPKVNGNPR